MSLSRLPSVSALLLDPRLRDLPHALAVRAAREAVAEARARLREGGEIPGDLAAQAASRAAELARPRLRRVINATGVVLHTNLGRAPLAAAAVAAAAAASEGYSNLEFDLESGQRGGRLAGVEGLLRELTGAEAALAVNNNAAAVLLALSALARGREVIVSRGELVEIGGSFRVPEVIADGGAILAEVGATNRSRVQDYAAAITDRTAALLRVHASNFRMVGFTARPERAALAALARERGIYLIEDLGSGLLGAAAGGAPGGWPSGLDAQEESVAAALAAGADLVCFSGDKLLGGPQAGIVVGKADLVARLRRHPLYRALRLDKLVLAALEATLQLYSQGRAGEIPTWRMLARSPDDCRAAAERMAAALPGARVEPDEGYSGGGALPEQALPTYVLAIPGGSGLQGRLRRWHPPIVARVAGGALRIDPRTLLPGEEEAVVAALSSVLRDG